MIELSFERIRAAEWPEVVALGHAEMDPRIASYAIEPRGAVRKARLKARLADVPGLADRAWPPELSFWIVAEGRRSGFLFLHRVEAKLHLQLVVLAASLRGTGAADGVLDFVERTAREGGAAAVDLFVDRRNYRAYHLYRRRGYALCAERRFIFDVPRAALSLPSPRAALALPLHALAEIFGSVNATRLARGSGAETLTLIEGRGAALSFGKAIDNAAIDAAIGAAFRGTLARSIRVFLPFDGNPRGGELRAILHRMERPLP